MRTPVTSHLPYPRMDLSGNSHDLNDTLIDIKRLETVSMNWQEVESVLQTASSKLKQGELLHGDDFSLQRTMTAVVVGSSRMDTLSGNDSQDPYELAKTDAASVVNLSFEEKLYIMDRLLTLQASFHEGTGLGRSLYTCLYLFNIERQISAFHELDA